MKQIEIIVPACIQMWYAKKKKKKGLKKMVKVVGWHPVYLNLNAYRNWNHYFSNDVKTAFNKSIFEQMLAIPEMKSISKIEYTLQNPTKKKRDKNNACCIIDKFFCDSLVYYGKIEDDDDSIIGETNFKIPEKIKGKQEEIACKVKIHYIEKE